MQIKTPRLNLKMLQNRTKPDTITPFRWNRAKERAAVRVSEGDMTEEQIAAEAGVHRVTVARWKKRAEFKERVAGLLSAYRGEIHARMMGEAQAVFAEG